MVLKYSGIAWAGQMNSVRTVTVFPNAIEKILDSIPVMGGGGIELSEDMGMKSVLYGKNTK